MESPRISAASASRVTTWAACDRGTANASSLSRASRLQIPSETIHYGMTTASGRGHAAFDTPPPFTPESEHEYIRNFPIRGVFLVAFDERPIRWSVSRRHSIATQLIQA